MLELYFSRLRFAFLSFWLVALVWGCNSGVDQHVKVALLSQDCLINSDCLSPLACAFKACHVQCLSSRDCDGGARCLAADHPYKVCQLSTELSCTSNRDCKEKLICGVDGQCRDGCQADTDCIEGQRCVSGTCADVNELDAQGQLTPAPGSTAGAEGTPCVYVSDCSSALLCRNQSCLPQCKSDVDCGAGQTCHDTRCEANGSIPQTCSYNSECKTAQGERCAGGICRCSCVENRDCPTGERCDGCACESDPNAPKACHYNSECDVAGQICRDNACQCACHADADCGPDQTCDGCGCVDTSECGAPCDPGYVCKNKACTLFCAGTLQLCGASCADLSTNPQHCGSCDQACSNGQACENGQCQDLGLSTSCWALHQRNPSAKSGVYALDPDGPDQGDPKFDAYCDMTNDGGGWTLVLKADGTKPTFNFTESIWEQATPFHPESADLSQNEAKLDSYSRIPVGAIRIVTDDGTTESAVVAAADEQSLYQAVRQPILAERQVRPTALGRAGWMSLFPGKSLIGSNCNLEGIDPEIVVPDIASQPLRIGVRIGLLSSTGSDCSDPEGYVGIGGEIDGGSTCTTGPGPSVGGVTACGVGGTFSAFGYVFVRELPRSCAEVKLQQPTAHDGVYRIDPDGVGALPEFDAYCDMTFDGGGWTLFFVQPAVGGSVEGIPAPGGNQYLPVATTRALALLGSQVHIRTAGLALTRSLTSIAGDYPIVNLRRGAVLNVNAMMPGPTAAVTGWTGPMAVAKYLWQGCHEDELGDTYPGLYHACNNTGGIQIDAGRATWIYEAADEDLEVYVR